jgi:hypothetical protein
VVSTRFATDVHEHANEHVHVRVGLARRSHFESELRADRAMRRQLSGAMFGVLFCTWILTAVTGMGVVAVSSLKLMVDPDHASTADDGAPVRPPPKPSTLAAALAVGVLMIVWPLPFCRRGPSSPETDGFGRGC